MGSQIGEELKALLIDAPRSAPIPLLVLSILVTALVLIRVVILLVA